MSETWRERLSRRRQEIGIDGPEYDYIKVTSSFIVLRLIAGAKKLI